jgi:two-component system CheB/CheR fusion protein
MAQKKSRRKSREASLSSEKPRNPLPAVNPAAPGAADPDSGVSFPIVCAGASAGGIEALKALLRNVPADTGMAFVVILHLSPRHDSQLADILGRETRMPVTQVAGNTAVEPNRVYVIPPGKILTLSQGVLQLAPRAGGDGLPRPVDHFMRSLAQEHGYKSIGVILSGSASDGTQGVEEIKAAGGITFAQDATAEHDGMPRSAIAAGSVDFVLPADEIGREIGRIARHPYVAADAARAEGRANDAQIGRVLELLRRATGVDFANYKRNTLHRRITRRMVLQKLEGLQEYVGFLEERPVEVQALYRDILIGVTSFFRNPEAYEALKQHVFPKLTEDKERENPVRVWALGCSTGEEAYSIAMAFTEWSEQAGRRLPMQIFATDLNGHGIEKARAGIYPKSIAQDLTPERLRRFFVEVDGHYRVAESIRDMCIFARQNVMADPPFSRMDLVACRNVLIYLEPVLQQRLMPMLHYALRPNGYLWLGSSETIGTFRELFHLEDSRHKIYAKRPAATRLAQLPLTPSPRVPHLPRARGEPVVERALEAPREADRMLLARYAPPAVLVNDDLEILQFRGDTSAYLTPAPGRASLNLLKMLREGLLVAVRSAVQKARRDGGIVRESNLKVRSNGGYRKVGILVMPIKGGDPATGGLLVVFEEPAISAEQHARNVDSQTRAAAEEKAAPKETQNAEILRLTQELDATRDYLQSVVEQQEAANEELQSANEEVQSANEELQSINEELETSKEEIQSSNEELATVNEELQNRNAELAQSNNDMANLLSSVNMPIVMLDRDLKIRRFTNAAEKLFNLIPADVGRSISDMKLRLKVADLEPLLLDTIHRVKVQELEVEDQSGHWHLMRLQPYRTSEDRIEGALLVLVDVDSLKRAEQSLRESDRSKTEFLAMLAHELRNPLAAVRSALEVWMADAPAPVLERARGIIDRQILHMTHMVDDLLDASRMSKGTIQLRTELLDLVGVLRNVIETSAHERNQMGHALEAQLPGHPVPMRGDATRLEQIFGNLLGNACKFTPRGGGQIKVSLETMPGAAVVRIRDNGAGIPPRQVEHVFELFASADRSLDRRHGGLGIGLALARKLVELHGGTIEARSAGAGQGSEFTVKLPVS